MPKINREEYEVLKELDDKWKWIARDEDGDLYAFDREPQKIKRMWFDENGDAGHLYEHESKFQFIQWEDEEPYSIAELIEEYEIKELRLAPSGTVIVDSFDESEETEANFKEKLKQEVEKIMTVTEYDGGWTVKKSVDVDKLFDLIDQLDESEVLSQEWIDEHAKAYTHYGFLAVPLSKLQNLLVPKQELPVIPKFVADYIQSSKGEDITLFSAMRDAFEDDENKIHDWLWDGSGDDSFQTFAKAWLAYPNIEVAKEQKYIVVLGKSIYNTTTYGQIGEVNSKKIMQSVYASEENIITPNQYTRSEILEVKNGADIFKRYAVKVEELEE